MLAQLFVGTLVSAVNVVISAALLGIAIHFAHTRMPLMMEPIRHHKTAFSLAIISIWLTAIVSICVWVWALTFLSLDLFGTLEEAVYFAIVCFTTLGFGDVLLDKEWRLLSGICAANGLLLFALSAAFLVEFYRRLMQALMDQD